MEVKPDAGALCKGSVSGTGGDCSVQEKEREIKPNRIRFIVRSETRRVLRTGQGIRTSYLGLYGAIEDINQKFTKKSVRVI